MKTYKRFKQTWTFFNFALLTMWLLTLLTNSHAMKWPTIYLLTSVAMYMWFARPIKVFNHRQYPN